MYDNGLGKPGVRRDEARGQPTSDARLRDTGGLYIGVVGCARLLPVLRLDQDGSDQVVCVGSG